jgi:hypothetical protein
MFNIRSGLISFDLKPLTELNNNVKEEIYRNINSFYIDIYDDESYLIWISNSDTTFLDILKKKLG